jgi:GNAT superfamily N-acetyltransferase
MDEPLLAPMIDSMREFQRAFGRAALDGGVIELPGVVACLTPGFGGLSLFNAAVYERPEDAAAALPELERRYREAGIVAWGVWTHSSDAEGARLLGDYGLKLDSTPAAMGRELDGAFERPQGVDVARADDLETFDLVSAGAWNLPVGSAVAAQPRLLEHFHIYLARDERGEPGCVVGTVHHRGDCGVTLVGTAPAARGRGLATAAMRYALAEATGAGCTTTTLQASAAGRPIYERMGFREFGTMNLWEMRWGPPPR